MLIGLLLLALGLVIVSFSASRMVDGASALLFVSCFVLRPMTIYRVEGWTILLLYMVW